MRVKMRYIEKQLRIGNYFTIGRIDLQMEHFYSVFQKEFYISYTIYSNSKYM